MSQGCSIKPESPHKVRIKLEPGGDPEWVVTSSCKVWSEDENKLGIAYEVVDETVPLTKQLTQTREATVIKNCVGSKC